METAFPGEYGVARPWYFPFTKAYWTGEPAEQLQYDGKGSKQGLDRMVLCKLTPCIADTADAKFLEKFEGHEEAGIEIEGLCKVFKVRPTLACPQLG
jgi:hypothetical protein